MEGKPCLPFVNFICVLLLPCWLQFLVGIRFLRKEIDRTRQQDDSTAALEYSSGVDHLIIILADKVQSFHIYRVHSILVYRFHITLVCRVCITLARRKCSVLLHREPCWEQ